MKFAFTTVALAALLAITLNSKTAEAQGLSFLGRELESKNSTSNITRTEDEKDIVEVDCEKNNCTSCNGTVDGFLNANGSFVNCTFKNGTFLNYTPKAYNKSSSEQKKNESSSENKTSSESSKKNKTVKVEPKFVWSSANASALIKSVQTPVLTSQLVSGSKKTYTIGYGHTKDVKAGQTINDTQADNFLTGDLKTASKCIEDKIWKKAKSILTDYQNTALVSFSQSVNCDIIDKYSKKMIAITDSATANAVFIDLIAKADNTTTSAYLTSRRAAEKALFGIV